MILGDVKKKNIPDVPGVYFFKKGKKILYIGKATSLSSRVRSYFQKELIEARSPLIEKMVEEADDVVWEETGSALEALIREAKLIKKYQPLYNTKEKDNKSFNYVVITKEPFPRLVVIRERELLNKKEALQDITIAHEFGPFTQGKSLNQALSIIRKIFPFRDRKSDNKQYEVFYKQIGLLPDTTKKNAQKAYNKTIENIVLLFEGNIEKSNVNAKSMEISQTGSFTGTAVLEEAKIGGSFDGNLKITGKLHITNTGKVSGKIKYSTLEIENGGQIIGDIKISNKK